MGLIRANFIQICLKSSSFKDITADIKYPFEPLGHIHVYKNWKKSKYRQLPIHWWLAINYHLLSRIYLHFGLDSCTRYCNRKYAVGTSPQGYVSVYMSFQSNMIFIWAIVPTLQQEKSIHLFQPLKYWELRNT